MAKDPACGINVDDRAPLKSTNAGKNYKFCSPSCKAMDPALEQILAGFLAQFDKRPGWCAPAAGREAQEETMEGGSVRGLYGFG